MYRTTLRRRPKGLVIAIPIVLCSLLLAGCSTYGSTGSEPQSTDSHKLSSMKAGVIPVADAGGFYTAEEKGIFANHKLTVSQEKIAGGAALIPALESGALDIGFSNLVSVLQAREKGLDVKCLAGTLEKAADGSGLALMLATKNSGVITSAAALDGKTIAVNTVSNINQLVADAWIDAHGGDVASVKFVAVNFPDMPAALTEGRVDAAIVDEPFVTVAKNAGATILDPRPYQAIAKTPVFSCWLVTTKWVDGHPAEAKAFIAAMKDAAAYLKANPDYLRKILPKYTSISEDLAGNITLPVITTELTADDYNVWQDAALKFRLIEKRVSPSELDAGLNN